MNWALFDYPVSLRPPQRFTDEIDVCDLSAIRNGTRLYYSSGMCLNLSHTTVSNPDPQKSGQIKILYVFADVFFSSTVYTTLGIKRLAPVASSEFEFLQKCNAIRYFSVHNVRFTFRVEYADKLTSDSWMNIPRISGYGGRTYTRKTRAYEFTVITRKFESHLDSVRFKTKQL